MAETNEKISWKNVVIIAGVFVSWAIGSGSVTGQASLQYFCGYGIWGFAGIAVEALVHLFLLISFFKLGHRRNFKSPLDIFTYYCGEKIGKVFQILSLGLLFAAPVTMISGFGAALNQHFGLPTKLGSILLGILCLVTVILGLKGLVNIIGSIGPFMIILMIGTGLYYFIQNAAGLSAGIEIAPNMGFSKIAPTWWLAGLYYVTCTPLQTAPFFTATAKGFKNIRELVYGAIVGVIFYAAADIVMCCSLFCNIEELGTQMIPNLYLANTISPMLGFIFIVVIFMAIFSSCAPSMFTLCAVFREEKTPAYNKFAVVLVVASVLCSMTLPFDKLLGLVYGVYGVLGGILVLFIVAKQFREKDTAE